MTHPSYRELLDRTDAPPGSSWGLFVQDPERGMANFAAAEQITAAARLVRRGVAINLDYPLDAFDPPISDHRQPPRHHLTSSHADQRDDYLDGFWLQISSQLDGLRHRRHHVHGFYNGVPDAEVRAGSPAIGVNRWAEVPLVGRGVLIDVDRSFASRGRAVDHLGGEHIDVAVLDEVLAEQNTVLHPGDFVLIRTGWSAWYLNQPDRAVRQKIVEDHRYTGLQQAERTIAWLWDHRIALAASDTVGLEALPPDLDSGYGAPTDTGLMHQELLGLLGLPIGELWNLDDLADDCAATGDYTCMVMSKPLNVVGGVGSPANAVAIR